MLRVLWMEKITSALVLDTDISAPSESLYIVPSPVHKPGKPDKELIT